MTRLVRFITVSVSTLFASACRKVVVNDCFSNVLAVVIFIVYQDCVVSVRSTGGPLFEFLAKLVQDKWKRLKLITCFFSQTYLSNSEVGRPDIFRPEKIFNHDRCVLLYLWSVWVYWELVLN